MFREQQAFCPIDADAGSLLQQLGWKDLITQRQIQETLRCSSRFLSSLASDCPCSMFTNRNGSGYALRDSLAANKSAFPLSRTNYLKKGFSPRGATL